MGEGTKKDEAGRKKRRLNINLKKKKKKKNCVSKYRWINVDLN